MSWRVIGDPLSGVAGLRALLQQSLHPIVTQGFAAHSRYRTESWARLIRTADFVALATFADTATVQATAAKVRRGHRLGWTDPETGTQRRLDDPDLLAWVHCCIVDAMLDVTVRGGLRLSGADQDLFVAEQRRFGALVGLDPDALPDDRSSLAAYFRDMLPQLRLTPAAHDTVATLLAPPLPTRLELLTPARIGWSAVAALSFGTLPRWARQLFPLPEGYAPVTDAAVTSGLRGLRRTATGVRVFAPHIGRSPHEQAARRRLALAS